MQPNVLEMIQLVLTGAVFVIGIMMRLEGAKNRLDASERDKETREWIMNHFVTKEACSDHRRSSL
jgi:hypothetical protein